MLAVAALASGSAPAQDMGRLFTTPAQRANLDELRDMARLQRAEPEPEPLQTPSTQPAVADVPAIERLTIDGLVRPSRGPGAVWINGNLVPRGGVSREGLRVEMEDDRPGIRVRLPSGAGSVALKPGQQIEVRSGTVLEPWERGPSSEPPSAFTARRGDSTAPPQAGDAAGAPEEAGRARPVPGAADAGAQQ
jgi:hypothetical protein